MIVSALSFAAGAATWSLAEYALHRFVGHGPRASKRSGKRGVLDGDFGSEHQAHHTDTRYFTPTPHKIRAAAIAVPALAAVSSLFVGPRRGISFALGFGVAYASYEIIHRRTHTHAPRGAYSRWTRKNHLAHHFTNPHMNHGVTSPVWDHLFGTHLPHAKIRVPRRHAPDWLLDPAGQVRPEYSDDYELPEPGARTVAQA